MITDNPLMLLFPALGGRLSDPPTQGRASVSVCPAGISVQRLRCFSPSATYRDHLTPDLLYAIIIKNILNLKKISVYSRKD